MDTFEALTKYVPQLSELQKYGKWHLDCENDGSPEHPIQMPYVQYDEIIAEFVEDVYRLFGQYAESRDYPDILKKYGIEQNEASLKNAPAEKMDGEAILALMIAVIRADRFAEGTLLNFFEEGYIVKWLQRLEQI